MTELDEVIYEQVNIIDLIPFFQLPLKKFHPFELFQKLEQYFLITNMKFGKNPFISSLLKCFIVLSFFLNLFLSLSLSLSLSFPPDFPICAQAQLRISILYSCTFQLFLKFIYAIIFQLVLFYI